MSRFRTLIAVVFLGGLGLLTLAITSSVGRTPLIEKPNLRVVDAVVSEVDVKKQYFVALMRNKPADWRAIEVKFPPTDPENFNYNIKAWLHLAWLGLEHENLKEASEAAAKVLQPRTSMTVDNASRVLAIVVQSIVHLYSDHQRAADAKMIEAKQLFETLTPEEKAFVQNAMPGSVLKHWYLPIDAEP